VADLFPRTGIYISDLHHRSIEDTILVVIHGQGVPLGMVSCSPAEAVLEIDLARAWSELGFDGGWSNIVPVEIFIQ
jgi:hypothetical protein